VASLQELSRQAMMPIRCPDDDGSHTPPSTTQTYVDSGSAYRVWLDGRRTGKIRNGHELTLPIEAGTHRLELRLWVWSSPVVTVEVEPGGRAELVCEPVDADRPMAVFSRMFTARKHYMELRRV